MFVLGKEIMCDLKMNFLDYIFTSILFYNVFITLFNEYMYCHFACDIAQWLIPVD